MIILAIFSSELNRKLQQTIKIIFGFGNVLIKTCGKDNSLKKQLIFYLLILSQNIEHKMRGELILIIKVCGKIKIENTRRWIHELHNNLFRMHT